MPALGLEQALEPRQVQVPELRPEQPLALELEQGLALRSEPVPARVRGWALVRG